MSKRKLIAAANWKLNKTIQEGEDFIETLIANLPQIQKCDIIIAPTFLALKSLKDKIEDKIQDFKISLCAQNTYFQNNGAFTGEVSPLYLKDAGCTHVIIGHSERRSIFQETDENIRLKIQKTQEEGLIPIFCIGETLEQREQGKIETVLETQITQGLKGINLIAEKLIIAYEPVWAIGTGKVASSQDAQNAHEFIRNLIKKLYDSQRAEAIAILYGGSVKPENIEELIGQRDIDGGLIGGASLKADSFGKIIEIMNSKT